MCALMPTSGFVCCASPPHTCTHCSPCPTVHKLLGIIILVMGTVHSISWWIAFATVVSARIAC